MAVAKIDKSNTRARQSRAKGRKESLDSLNTRERQSRAKGGKESLDSLNMRKIILDFPKQLKIGLQAAENIKISGKFNKVIICGMGGSALPGDILEMVAEDLKINLPIYVHRNYNLPYFADRKSLIICISYSGNTEETISSFREALRKKIKVITISSGGELTNLCRKYRIPVVFVPKGYQPRMALGFQFASLIKVLANCRMIKDNLRDILMLEDKLKPKSLEKEGKDLAKKLSGKIPVIYSSEKLKGLTRIWKNKINESSKTLVLTNFFPELNHNEMSGFIKPRGEFHLIIFRDPKDNPKILKRMDLTTKILKSGGINVDIIKVSDKNIFLKIFSNIILSDWVSYHLALQYRVNPLDLKLQEEFKKGIKNN